MNKPEQYIPGWRDPRKMSEDELIVDYYTHNPYALVRLFRERRAHESTVQGAGS